LRQTAQLQGPTIRLETCRVHDGGTANAGMDTLKPSQKVKQPEWLIMQIYCIGHSRYMPAVLKFSVIK
jgi:hypothetical protein